MKTIAVIFGGTLEYAASLRPAQMLLERLDPKRYEAIPLGITPQGEWLRYGGPLERLSADTWSRRDCVPAVLSPSRAVHGLLEFQEGRARQVRLDAAIPLAFGLEGSLQALLDLAGIPCVGGATLPAALCQDRELSRRLAREAGVPVPHGVVLTRRATGAEYLGQTASLRGLLLVGPVSSGVRPVQISGRAALPQAVEEAFSQGARVMVEEYTAGAQLCCTVDEEEGGGLSFSVEQLDRRGQCRPVTLPGELEQRLRDNAAAVYRALRCVQGARLLFSLSPSGALLFLQASPLPLLPGDPHFPALVTALLERAVS